MGLDEFAYKKYFPKLQILEFCQTNEPAIRIDPVSNLIRFSVCLLPFPDVIVKFLRIQEFAYFIKTYFHCLHNDVVKWKYFSVLLALVQEIHRSPVNSPCKGQWRGTMMFSLLCVRINGWVNNCEYGDLKRHQAHYDVIVMSSMSTKSCSKDRFWSECTESNTKKLSKRQRNHWWHFVQGSGLDIG